MATEANDDVRAARLIFALGLEGRERAQFARAVAALFRGYLRLGRLDAAYGSVLDFIPYVSLGLVLAFGSRAVVDGRISLGEFVTFFGFASILSVASNQVGYFTYLVASAAGSATRILELLHHPREPAEADDADTGGWGGLTLEGVSVTQQGTAAPLEDVDLDITPGETIAIVGATGAGKSTLLDVVDGLIEPERGEIATGGTHPAGVGLGGLRRLAALGGEGSGLFSMSIADNIAYGRPGATAAEIKAAARRAHADSVVARLPDGYETQVGEEGGRLSGGERQRIALARALLVEPRILLLNNITSSLDPKAANEVLSSLADAAGADRVLTTNDVATLTWPTASSCSRKGASCAPARTRSCSDVPAIARWSRCGRTVTEKKPPEAAPRCCGPGACRSGSRWSDRRGDRRPWCRRWSPPMPSTTASSRATWPPWTRRSSCSVSPSSSSADDAVQTYATAWISQRALASLRTEVFDHLTVLSPSFYDRASTGALISRLTNDVEQLENRGGGAERHVGGVFALDRDARGHVRARLAARLVSLWIFPVAVGMTAVGTGWRGRASGARATRSRYRRLRAGDAFAHQARVLVPPGGAP